MLIWSYMYPEKCLIALLPKVKEHLAKMEALGVITHVDQSTDWVSSITYVQKANGEFHLCLDLCDINRAICCNHHKMPTVEEVAHEFANSHYFTKLNACYGYWSIVLDEESSLLTTFNSPFGRYHFLHLPFVWSTHRTSSRRRWTSSLKSALDVLESPMTSPYMVALRQNMTPICETSCR